MCVTKSHTYKHFTNTYIQLFVNRKVIQTSTQVCVNKSVIHTSVHVCVNIPHPSPPQIYFKTPSGDLQTVVLQEASSLPVLPPPPSSSSSSSAPSCGSPVSRSPGLGPGRKPAPRKERPLPKIAPAGGILSLNAAQLAAAAQAVQTININGVQVQGVPVTITSSAGGWGVWTGGVGCGRVRVR